MKNILHRLSQYWFTPVAPQRLAILRIATGSFSLWYLLNRVKLFSNLSESGQSMFEPIGLAWWLQNPLPDTWMQIFFWLTIALNVAYVLGWKYRWSGPSFALALLFLLSYRNSWSMIYHDLHALVLQVLVIGFAGSAAALSLDAGRQVEPASSHWRYGWPVRLICAVTVLTYFLAGVAKVTSELGWSWASGEALRSQVAADTLRKEVLGGGTATPLFEWMYEHPWMFMIMGVSTLVLELGAPLALAHRRAGITWAVLTWLMHWGIFFVMDITFRFQLAGLIFLPFFEVEKLLPWLRNQWMRLRGRRENVPPTRRDSSSVVAFGQPVVLFDGVCNFCDATVRFIMRHDKKGRFLLAAQQSEAGKVLLQQYNAPQDLSTIYLVANGKIYDRSTAILYIMRHLAFPWPLASLGLLAPKALRDGVYHWIAVNRYKWFGQKETCSVPLPEWRARFLS